MQPIDLDVAHDKDMNKLMKQQNIYTRKKNRNFSAKQSTTAQMQQQHQQHRQLSFLFYVYNVNHFKLLLFYIFVYTIKTCIL